ncbi:MAG: zinc transporter ZntB [Kiloniellales bacterium]|nr:zinc transporter ZntB [Kiloniellales bacterium]
MAEQDGLVFAYRIDGEGKAQSIGWEELSLADEDEGWLWIHLDRSAPRARDWLAEESGIDPLIVSDALLDEETRPRFTATEEGFLLILRGVNQDPSANPEDMVSIRIWAQARRLVSVRLRNLLAVEDLQRAVEAGAGPKTPGELVSALARGMVERLGGVISDLEDRLDDLEDEVLSSHRGELRGQLNALRREGIILRRYIAPQRDALAQLTGAKPGLFKNRHLTRLREVADDITRHVESLDSGRERAAVVQDELMNRLSEELNRNMFALSVIAGLFLPLGFVTGLLGVNLGGIPGAETPWAFAALCASVLGLGLLELWLFRRFKWI